jgi:carbonic anhydrase
MIEHGHIALVGAMYSVETGSVAFLEDTLTQGARA